VERLGPTEWPPRSADPRSAQRVLWHALEVRAVEDLLSDDDAWGGLLAAVESSAGVVFYSNQTTRLAAAFTNCK